MITQVRQVYFELERTKKKMATEFLKGTCTIPKGKLESTVIAIKGAKVRFLGLPVDDKTGRGILGGQELSFSGAFGASAWFTINDFEGAPVRIPAKATQNESTPDSYLATAEAILPIREPAYFDGIPFIRIHLARAMAEDISISLYFGG
jgi:hypothetical protein